MNSFAPYYSSYGTIRGTLACDINSSTLLTTYSGSAKADSESGSTSQVRIYGKYKDYVLDLSEKWYSIDSGHIRVHFTNQGAPFNIKYRVHNITTGDASAWLTQASAGCSTDDVSWLDEATTSGNQYTYTVDYSFNETTGYATKNLGSITVDTQAPSGNISVPEYSNSATVTLTNTATDNVGVTHVRYSLDGSNWDAWETYSSNKSHTLPGEGTYTIYAQYKDAMNNESASGIYDTVTVDLTNPTGSVLSQSGSNYVSSTANLITAASDTNSVTQMMISLNSDFSGASWIAYNGTNSITITDTDGPYNIYVKYRDVAGNESEAYSLSVIKDTIAPENCTMTLQGLEGIPGETKSQSITVLASGSDANSLYGISVSNDNSSWSPVCTTLVGSEFQYVNYLLTEGRGIKTVYVRIYDSAGNFTLVNDTIRYDEDTTLPICSLIISNSASYTLVPDVSIAITANDNATFTTNLQYRLSNDGLHWSSYNTFASTVTWNLLTDAGGTNTEGSKTVYLNIRDESGNVGYATATIIYSATKPEVTGGPLATLIDNCTDPNLNVSVQEINGNEILLTKNNFVNFPLPFDATTAQYRVAISDGDWGNWTTFNSAVLQQLDLGLGEGYVRIRIQGRNANGALSDENVLEFLIDCTPPEIKTLAGKLGATATKSSSFTIVAEVTDNRSPVLNYCYSINGGAWSPLLLLGNSGAKNEITIPGLVAGLNEISIEISDINGNIATGSVNVFYI